MTTSLCDTNPKGDFFLQQENRAVGTTLVVLHILTNKNVRRPSSKALALQSASSCSLSLTFRILLRRRLKAFCFLVVCWVSCQGLVVFLLCPKLLLGLQAENHPALLFIVMEVKIISRVEHNFRWRQLRVIELSSCAAASPKPSCCPIIFLGDCCL